MISQDLMRTILAVRELPTLPQVIEQVLDTVANERSSSGDLAGVLERDHAISSRLLRVANSAFYGLPAQVESIRRAVVLLGFDTVKMLALATSVFDIFMHSKQSVLSADDFWMHSLGAAKASQILVKKHRVSTSPEACFSASLIHDIGKFLLAICLGADYDAICLKARDSNRRVATVEMETIKTTYAEVGAWIGAQWHFPEIITTSIGEQCNATYGGPFAAESGVVALSDTLSRLAGFGFAGDPEILPTSSVLANPFGLRKETLTAVIQELRLVEDETRELIEAMSS